MNYQPPPSAWTDERVARLKELLPTGASASTIAADLGGGLSRNAVIGKAGRLGLQFAHTRASGSRKAMLERKLKGPKTFRYAVKPKAVTFQDTLARQAAAAELAQDLATETVELTIEQRATTVTLLQLGKYHCRWPLGRPGTPDFCFCGDTVAEGKPYCTPHWRRAHERALQRHG